MMTSILLTTALMTGADTGPCGDGCAKPGLLSKIKSRMASMGSSSCEPCGTPLIARPLFGDSCGGPGLLTKIKARFQHGESAAAPCADVVYPAAIVASTPSACTLAPAPNAVIIAPATEAPKVMPKPEAPKAVEPVKPVEPKPVEPKKSNEISIPQVQAPANDRESLPRVAGPKSPF